MYTLSQMQKKQKEYQYTKPKKRLKSTHNSTKNQNSIKLPTKDEVGTTIFHLKTSF